MRRSGRPSRRRAIRSPTTPRTRSRRHPLDGPLDVGDARRGVQRDRVRSVPETVRTPAVSGRGPTGSGGRAGSDRRGLPDGRLRTRLRGLRTANGRHAGDPRPVCRAPAWRAAGARQRTPPVVPSRYSNVRPGGDGVTCTSGRRGSTPLVEPRAAPRVPRTVRRRRRRTPRADRCRRRGRRRYRTLRAV